ncbi:MAG: cation:proton antiporter [Deltaproteobacteria bacterium]|nr:cation:proton antiporter [Deltaproteobacteria bacterium]
MFSVPLAIGLLVAAIAVSVAAKRARVPYNISLVVGGMLLSISGLFPQLPRLEPDVVFLLCLPALLFEGGITADLRSIRSNALPIGLLATLGMLVAIGGTAVALWLLLELPWIAALLLGTLLSVTDTVSILYAFRRAKVPRRLAGIMEGESLFNDGTALVVYSTLLGLLAGSGFSPGRAAAQVLVASTGGAGIGLALGLAAGWVVRRLHDPLTEIMVTTSLALGAYLGAEQLHLSGAIAAVTTGLAVATTLRRDLAPQSQVALLSFWEYVAFGVNTFLFLSVGMSTSFESLIDYGPKTVAAIGCVLAGRAAGVYLPFLLLRLARPAHAVPLRWQHVFVIGNIKGALSIALALGLPASTPERSLLVHIAFGVTFVSLLAQGLSLGGILRAMGLVARDGFADASGDHRVRLLAARAARRELEALRAVGQVPQAAFEQLQSAYQVTIAQSERELRRLYDQNLAHGARAQLATRRCLIDAERTAVLEALRGRLIPEESAERFLRDLDARLVEIERVLSSAEHDEWQIGGSGSGNGSGGAGSSDRGAA